MTLYKGDGSKSQPFERVDGQYRVEDYPWLDKYRPEDYPFKGQTEATKTDRDERDDYLDELWELVQKAGKSVAFQWPGVVDEDDAAQAIALRMIESPASIKKIAEMDDRARYRAIVGIGHQIASKERVDYDLFKGAYNYSVAEVKDLLKMGVLTDPPPNFRCELVDMDDALRDMVPQYVEAITSRYADNVVPQQGEASVRLSRALTSLTNKMNTVAKRRYAERDDGPGTRTAMTSDEARYVSSDQYDGDDPDWEETNRVEGGGGWAR